MMVVSGRQLVRCDVRLVGVWDADSWITLDQLNDWTFSAVYFLQYRHAHTCTFLTNDYTNVRAFTTNKFSGLSWNAAGIHIMVHVFVYNDEPVHETMAALVLIILLICGIAFERRNTLYKHTWESTLVRYKLFFSLSPLYILHSSYFKYPSWIWSGSVDMDDQYVCAPHWSVCRTRE